MAFRRSTRSRGFPAKRPNLTTWGRVTIPVTNIAAGTKVLLATFALSNPGITEVVRRTRGRFLFTSDQASSYENTVPVIGFIVVNDLAVAAGAASIPGPLTDASDDGWFVWEGYPGLYGSTNTGGSLNNASNFAGIEFDSKAMRRVEEGFTIAIMGEVAAFDVEVSAAISLLSSRG